MTTTNGSSGRWRSQALTVLAKELTELFRDWRTVVISVAVPLLLFPMLVSIVFASTRAGYGDAATRVAVTGIDRFSVAANLASMAAVEVIPVDGADAASDGVASGRYSLAIVFAPVQRESAQGHDASGIFVIYDNSDQRSVSAVERVRSALDQLASSITVARLESRGVSADLLDPWTLELLPLYDGATGAGRMALAFLVPVLALIAGAISPVAAATDLGAGEKERGTMEPLFGTCADRVAIVIGKFGAVTVMGVLGMVSFFAGSALAYLAGPVFFGAESLNFRMNPGGFVQVLGFVVLTAAVFSAVELTVSFLARSAKAAQALVLPVLILASASGYGAVGVNEPPSWYAHVPLLNLGLSLKSAVLGGSFRPLVVGLWALVYATAALSVCVVLVRSEATLRRS